MANLDNIKDIVLTYADQYAQELSARAPRRTGRLADSYRGVAKFEQNKFTIEVYGEDYGIYQDSGVHGAFHRITPDNKSLNPPGQFKLKRVNGTNRFKPIGGDLPLQQRFVIMANGLKPQPFMQDAIDVVNTSFIADLEDAGVKDVEQNFETLTKIEVK